MDLVDHAPVGQNEGVRVRPSLQIRSVLKGTLGIGVENRTAQMPTVYLPVEVAPRELDSRLLLACILANKGARVLIGPSFLRRIALLLGHGVLLHNAHSHHDKAIFGELHRNNIAIAALYEEGVLTSPRKGNVGFARELKLKEIENFVSIFFTWGPDQHKGMETAYPDLHHKLVFSGNPRFDLLDRRFETLRKGAKFRVFHPTGRPLVLFNSSAVLGNLHPSYGSSEDLISNYFKEGDEGWAEAIEDTSYHRDVFAESIELMSLLATTFPEIDFLVRPHPSENPSTWKTLAKRFRNLKVSQLGAASEWIDKASLVLHTGCTTAIEARLIGRPVITYRPSKPPSSEPLIWGHLGTVCFSREEVCSAVAAAMVAADSNQPVEQNILETILFRGTTESGEIIADRLFRLASESMGSPERTGRNADGLKVWFALLLVWDLFLGAQDYVLRMLPSAWFSNLRRKGLSRAKFRRLDFKDAVRKLGLLVQDQGLGVALSTARLGPRIVEIVKF